MNCYGWNASGFKPCMYSGSTNFYLAFRSEEQLKYLKSKNRKTNHYCMWPVLCESKLIQFLDFHHTYTRKAKLIVRSKAQT